jgi:SNF2 family DNA or RNA helicase
LKKRGKTVAAANMAVASGKLSQICQGFLYAGEDDDETTGKMQGYERIHDMKMETLLDILDEADGEQAVLTYEYQADLDRLMKEWPDLRYFGKSDAGDRQIEQEWNAGTLSKIAVQPASAGHGLNLQYGGTQVIGYGLTWSAELFDQLIKRFHRPGQVRPVWWRPIMARGAGITTTDQMKRLRVHDKMTLQAVFQQLLKEV